MSVKETITNKAKNAAQACVNISPLVVTSMFVFILLSRSCQYNICEPKCVDQFELLTGTCVRDTNSCVNRYNELVFADDRGPFHGATFDEIYRYIGNPTVEVNKQPSEKGSYYVEVTFPWGGLLPDSLRLLDPTAMNRKLIFYSAKPTQTCADLISDKEHGGRLACVALEKDTTQETKNENSEPISSITVEVQQPADERVQEAQKQIEEAAKKSELKSMSHAEAAQTPEEICYEYLGSKYKKGVCTFPVKKEPMYGRAGLEKKFKKCQINEIIAGKGNTATVHAVCSGVPSIINVKRYYQKGR